MLTFYCVIRYKFHSPVPHVFQIEMDGVVQEEDLEKIEKEVMLNKQDYLVNHVKPDDIYDSLIAKKLIGNFASEKVLLPTNTTDEKVRILLEDVRRSRPGYLKEFCVVLKESRTQDHVVAELQKGMYSRHWVYILDSSDKAILEQSII